MHQEMDDDSDSMTDYGEKEDEEKTSFQRLFTLASKAAS